MRQAIRRHTSAMLTVFFPVSLCLAAGRAGDNEPTTRGDPKAHCNPAKLQGSRQGKGYSRKFESYDVPKLKLVDMNTTSVDLGPLLAEDRPVMLQFIFTTCTTICPVLSNTFAGLQTKLEPDPTELRMISISIDPEHDTPERLRAYARRLKAGSQWRFLTGAHADIVRVQKAFDVYSQNKMNHEPLTFIRATPDASWVRLNGLMSAADLLAEYRSAMAAVEANVETGRQLYERAIDASGRPVRATVLGDVPIDATLFSCESCHRRSGFGSSEGGMYVPPVTGSVLFRRRQWRGQDLMRNLYREDQPRRFRERVRQMRTRSAYTSESLARAIRSGVDPDGRELDPTMPRYQLSDKDIGHLEAYLRTLYRAPSPGVDDSKIHLATVVMEGVDPGKRKAMLDVFDAFLRRKNTFSRHELEHPGHSPGFKDYYYTAHREWVLHVWELKGRRENWSLQLDNYYRKDPVFALISGIGVGSWRPVHEFCERNKVPCLFPNTNLPVVSDTDDYTFYFSKGLQLEAATLARYLQEGGEEGRTTRVVQVYRKSDTGIVPARILRGALQRKDSFPVQDQIAHESGELTPTLWRDILRDQRPSVLVLWLKDVDLNALSDAIESSPAPAQIYFSASLNSTLPTELPSNLRGKVFLIYPFGLPRELEPTVFHDRSWFHSRGIKSPHERVQLNTYFALTMARNALMHIIDSFSREYFIEGVEHDTEECLTFGAYARLSLGRGQRFASKGCYVVQLSTESKNGLKPVSHWIVP